ncbi:hypothetical protein [Vibrio sp.]|uniref:hypothetical protein n=1 Tax=Vibrio sp. TaxID=678 RepID=UPI003AA98AF5
MTERDGTKGDGDFFTYLAVKPSIDFARSVFMQGGINAFFDYKGSLSAIDKEDGVSYMYGVGAEYFLLDNISVGAS